MIFVRNSALLSWGLPLAISVVWANSGAAQPVVQNCAPETYVDRTAAAADRSITWGFSIQSDPERCMQIRAGQGVTWVGSFGAHPLDPAGGNVPNPIANHVDGRVSFPTPGVYGYVCGVHPQMNGAVHVLPAEAATPVPAGGWPAAGALALGMVTIGMVCSRRQRRA